MIDTFLSELALVPAKLYQRIGDDLNPDYQLISDLNGYLFGEYTNLKADDGLTINSTLNIYLDLDQLDWKFGITDRIVIDGQSYEVKTYKKSRSLVDMNFYKLGLSYVGEWQ